MKLLVVVAAVAALVAGPAAAQDSSVELLAVARAHLAAHHLDSAAAADAFRHALALDPGFEVAALAQFDPEIAKILAAERAALPSRTEPAAAKPVPVYECLGKCPEGVWPPHFTSFPQIDFPMDASVGVHDTRMRTFLLFEGVVSAEGVIEPETLITTGGTARRTETELRRGLLQARFSRVMAR